MFVVVSHSAYEECDELPKSKRTYYIYVLTIPLHISETYEYTPASSRGEKLNRIQC